MTTIVLADLHDALKAANLPIISMRSKAGAIELVFTDDATSEQKAAAQALVDSYDQATIDAKKPQPVTMEDIEAAKTVADMKALMIRMLNEKV